MEQTIESQRRLRAPALLGRLRRGVVFLLFLTVATWEALVRIRRPWSKRADARLGLQLLDMARIGLIYGLLLEGFKML